MTAIKYIGDPAQTTIGGDSISDMSLRRNPAANTNTSLENH